MDRYERSFFLFMSKYRICKKIKSKKVKNSWKNISYSSTTFNFCKYLKIVTSHTKYSKRWFRAIYTGKGKDTLNSQTSLIHFSFFLESYHDVGADLDRVPRMQLTLHLRRSVNNYLHDFIRTMLTGCPQGLNVNIPAFFGKSLYKFQPIRVDFGTFFQPFYAKSTLFPAIKSGR